MSRDQRQDVSAAPASSKAIDEENRSVWGLDLTETPGKPAKDVDHTKDQILYAILSAAVENRQQLLNFYRGSWDDKSECATNGFRNLTNAWRDEFALGTPRGAGYDERVRTAEWRIIKSYFALYKSVAAIIHTRHSSPQKSHAKTLRVHQNEFMNKPDARCIYSYPFNFPPDSPDFFEFSLPYPVSEREHRPDGSSRVAEIRSEFHEESKERMESLFKEASATAAGNESEGTATFYHVMKALRKWANYEHGSIFVRLYGDGYRKAIDRSLQLLTHTALTTAEVATISSFGIDRFEEELRDYQDACEEGVSKSDEYITYRFDKYERALSDF